MHSGIKSRVMSFFFLLGMIKSFAKQSPNRVYKTCQTRVNALRKLLLRAKTLVIGGFY